MARLRKLWRVTQGFDDGLNVDPSTVVRPESQAKAYSVYVHHNVVEAGAARDAGHHSHDFTDVWVDERDGRGWQWYERIRHDGEGG